MNYRTAVLSAIFLASAIRAYAVDHITQNFKGACATSELSQSDGVKTVMNGMPGKEFVATMKRARENNLTLGPDSLLWSTKPVRCDSIGIVQMSDYPGHTVVVFSDGPKNPVLGFDGGRINGDGPMFFSNIAYLSDGNGMPLSPGSGQGCHFYFTDHGSFTDGWERRLTTVECNLRVKTETGRLVRATVTFNLSHAPTAP